MARKNEVLAQLLREVGWSQSELMRAVNRLLGTGYVCRSTVAEWVNQARVPRDPVATVVAHVLSEVTARDITLDDLWQGRAKSPQLWLPALEGLQTSWDHVGTLHTVHDWLDHGETTLDFHHRSFLPLRGSGLSGPVWSYLDCATKPISQIAYQHNRRNGCVISSAMTEIVALVVAHLRCLDDSEGGSLKNLRFVHRHLLTVGQQISSGEAADSAVLTSLLRVWMQLNQLAGWMAYDAEQHGLAQRYWYTGLHAARSIQDRSFGAYLLALLANQAVYRGKAREATDLANAATEAAKGAPASIRAVAGGVLAHTEALVGNAHGFQTGIDRVLSLIEAPDASDNKPDWLYWYSPAQVRVQQGHALLALARASSRPSQQWLTDAARLLAPHAVLDDAQFPREAVYNRVWLARSQLWRGEVDTALRTVRSTLAEHVVRPPRTVAQLRALDDELARQPSSWTPGVAELRGNLRDLLLGVGQA